MQITIIGAGAMGCLFAYFFNKCGMNVRLFEINPDTVEKLRLGLNVTIDDKSTRISVAITDTAESLSDTDAVFLFVKSYATDSAMNLISPFISPQTMIVSLQNGIGNREIIAGHAAPGTIVYGSTTYGAAKPDPGTVIFGGSGDIIIGGENSDTVGKATDLFKNAGLAVSISSDPESVIWKKAVVNAGINPLGALLGIPNGKILENPNTLALQDAIVREAVAVAHGLNIFLDFSEMVRMTRDVCARTALNRCSMLQDIEAGRKTEIDSINGYINRQGKILSIDTPVNETLFRLIKSMEKAATV